MTLTLVRLQAAKTEEDAGSSKQGVKAGKVAPADDARKASVRLIDVGSNWQGLVGVGRGW